MPLGRRCSGASHDRSAQHPKTPVLAETAGAMALAVPDGLKACVTCATLAGHLWAVSPLRTGGARRRRIEETEDGLRLTIPA